MLIVSLQITCLVTHYKPNRLFVHFTGSLYTLQVICTVQVTCLVHIYKSNRLFVHFTGYLYSTSNLFSAHI